jgi:hypothetical protein
MKNIIVFFSHIQDKQILINSLNQDTSYIEYDNNTTSDVNTFLNRGNTSLIKFSDLYRTSGTLIGGLANLTAPNIPTTTGNAISLNNLRGASRIG